MNYIKIHDKFINYFKSTTPLERMIKRNKQDERIGGYIYTETHHILPTSQGGNDLSENLVELLPEEHIFIHFLRFKAFKNRNDMLAFRYCLNGFKNPSKSKELVETLTLNKKIRAGYALLKQYSALFRKEHGWQTKEGRKNISKARKNKVPVMDSETGEMIGSVDRNHPNIILGKWVHCTKGFVTMIDTRTNKKVRIKCSDRKEYHKVLINQEMEGNGNYSGITDDFIIEKSLEFIKKYNVIPSFPLLYKYCCKNNIKMIRILVNYRFKDYGCSVNGYIKCMEEKSGLKYDTYCKKYKEVCFKISGSSFKNQYSVKEK